MSASRLLSRRVRAFGAVLGLACPACQHQAPLNLDPSPTPPTLESNERDAAADPVPAVTPVSAAGPLHFLVVGGGPTPENNEVSLEQDVESVARALPGPGLVLFAGGSGSPSVRELDPRTVGDPVKIALGELFAPRSGRHSRYRVPHFTAERATLENVEGRLSAALAEGDGPLLVYIAGHGEQGSEPRSNSVALWGGHSLSVARLAELHEQRHRPLRLVATSCFSGGFGELAFAHADPKRGRPASVPRCGLFAGTADRETSGCDPNPNRRAQESYGLHFVHALSGTRKDGSALPLGEADYDHDGKIGLLDAHTWARIAAVSFDVPTTTSERWLRSVEPGGAALDKTILPEEWAVIEQLGGTLGLTTEKAVEKRWTELDQQISELDDAVDAAEEASHARELDETTLLLERWPVLDDPFHPEFDVTFRQNRAAIERVLTRSPQALARAEAGEPLQELYERLGQLGVDEARVLRVRRAYETLHKASALLRKGGAAAKYYSSLLACERGAP
jgi:hypothetical protein